MIQPEFGPWREWFAWRPVTLKDGTRCWFKKIYRRAYAKDYTNYDDWTRYQYGTLFDVLAENNDPQGPELVAGTTYYDANTKQYKVYDGAFWFPLK